jgi:hypothetical protein
MAWICQSGEQRVVLPGLDAHASAGNRSPGGGVDNVSFDGDN